MKTKILLFTAVILLNLLSFGQSEQIIDSFEYEFFHNPKTEFKNPLYENDEQLTIINELLNIDQNIADLWILDSIVSYEFTSDIDSFSVERLSFTYDEINNKIEYFIMRRSSQSNPWGNIIKYLSTNNNNNQQTQIIVFDWIDGQWQKTRKTEYVYDENNNEIEQSNYNWMAETESWFHSYKIEFGYNEQGLMNFILLYTLDFETNELTWIEKQETTYNEKGMVLAKITFRWDNLNSIWLNYDKYNSHYTGNVWSTDYYSWNSNEWKLFRHSGHRRDSLIVDFNSYYFRDDTAWIHNLNGELVYDENDNIISQESYRLQESHGYWFGAVKFDKSFYDNGLFEGQTQYDWNFSDEEWVNYIKYHNGYNKQNIITYFSTEDWNTDESKWQKEKSKTYYFNNTFSIFENYTKQNNITVYPNPCSNTINLVFDDQGNDEVFYKIYSILGEFIDEGYIYSYNSNTINISNLDKGYYLMKAIVGNKHYSGKFVKL